MERTEWTFHRLAVAIRGLLVMGLLLLLTLVGCSDDDKTPCQPVALYGPPPCDTDTDCEKWLGTGWYCDKANAYDNGCGDTTPWAACKQTVAPDGGITDGCIPAMLYGPQPCASNTDCETQYGAGWYCDKDNVFGNGCGGTSSWPICRQSTATDAGLPDGPCFPAALYGPPPCNTDTDCVQWNGAGWYCDKTNSYDDGCGNKVVWPLCLKK